MEVRLVMKNGGAPVAACNDMVERAGEFNAGFASHAENLRIAED
jgi:hypothetical protein